MGAAIVSFVIILLLAGGVMWGGIALTRRNRAIADKQSSVPARQPVMRETSGWSRSTNGGTTYYSQKARSLYAATEILRSLEAIPPLTYYLVDTQDGTLGRDVDGFFTEAPVKTSGLVVEHPTGGTDAVQPESLTGFGNVFKSQMGIAHQRLAGQYAKLVLMMKCGTCGYDFPVETEAGDLVRQCYRCGTINQTHRGTIAVSTQGGKVEI